MTELTPALQKWLKKRVKNRFATVINKKLQDQITLDTIVDTIIQENDLKDLIKSTKVVLREQKDPLGVPKSKGVDFELKSSLSFTSDLSNDDWTSLKPGIDHLEVALDNLKSDKPIHVRLAGFEALLESELTNNCEPEVFESLTKSLRDGISDDSRPVFDASLKVHSKLLKSSRAHDVYTNLINAFENEYNSKKLHATLPNFNTGINFKVFLHEKLFRILFVITRHQKEVIKLGRGIDRTVEEMIDQFVVFLNSHNVSSPLSRPLTPLNLISVLDPQANWSRKWIHNLATRRNLFTAIAKSPSVLQNILEVMKKGLVNTPSTIAFSVTNSPAVVFISSETIEVMTYLHCLNFLSQIFSCSLGRTLLGECALESPPSPIDFIIALVTSLNTLASSTSPRLIYNQSRHALKTMLSQPTFPSDSRLFQVGLNPLMKPLNGGSKLWMHTIDILNFMIETKDGLQFFVDEYQRGSASINETKSVYPCSMLLIHVADLLRQPFAVINVGLLVEAFKFIGKFFESLEDISKVQETLENHFFPSIEYFYSRINKYCIGNESKTQNLDSAAKGMLLKISSNPLGLRLLSGHPITFDETIRTSINPLKHSWRSNEVVAFISTATLFPQGRYLIGELIPQTFSMFLADVCENLENPLVFFDPWDTENTKSFLHLLALLSINTECFQVLLMDTEDDGDDYGYPRSFCELLKYAMIADSPYHGFSLHILDSMVWNLNILVHLLNIYDLHKTLLELQDKCLLEVRKFREKSEDEEEQDHQDVADEPDDELHSVYVIDELSHLRHQILLNSFFIKHKLTDRNENIEKSVLFSNFPPPESEELGPLSKSESSSELDEFLQECKPGLRDSSWVMQVKKCHKNSQESMKHGTLISLLDQMEKAIPAVEWVDVFKWNNKQSPSYDWLPEDELALDLAIRYAEDNCEQLEDELNARDNLKKLFEDVHGYINSEKQREFAGFDWFLATIFIICNGAVDKSKVFVKQLVRFPSAMFMWQVLAKVADKNNEDILGIELTVAQHIESVVNQELPALNYALKREFGIKWWMICNTLLSQCFWGVLKWPEIINFFAICILNPPDYIIYYCVALLQHCETILMQDIIDKKSWPENMNFSEFQSHSHFGFIERMAKRHSNQILPSLTQRKLISTE